jgi:adenylate cyclase class IV
MIKKGETRAVVDPKKILRTIRRLGLKKAEECSGIDTYFDKALFQKGYHFRVRKQPITYLKKEVRNFIYLKPHKPNFRKMNVYNTFALTVNDTVEAINLLKLAGHKPIFLEKWDRCSSYEIDGLKIELCYIYGWNWIVEIEGVIKTSEAALYKKILKTAKMLGLEEKDLTNIEPANYLFKKKYG